MDPREFVTCGGSLALDVEVLAKKLGVFIAVYHAMRPVASNATHLCQTYRVALLRPDEVKLLHLAEQRNPGTVFVAYARPLHRVGK
ncbi:MAG TPA: hypothetical protein VKU41_18955 [Polyangiaceae bacterium]|nr:hypothetical protein [Polyangiaceae bacterium]